MNRIVIALLKPFSFIPAILMMSLIFSFSSQNGTESSQLSEKVARGIFITLSSFHPEAQKLLDKVDNLTGVNGDKLFEIAKRCRLGLGEKDGRLCIDEELLLNT